MKLTGNNILFKPFLSEAVTQGGLIVPETARKYGSKGVITGTVFEVMDTTMREPYGAKSVGHMSIITLLKNRL